jgi:hypothetical protein
MKRILPVWQQRYETLYDFWTSAAEPDYYLIDKGIYWQSIKRLLGYYNPKNILVIKSETFFADPQYVYNNTLNFLGVSPYSLEHPSHSRKNFYEQPDPSLLEEIAEFYSGYGRQLEETLEDEKVLYIR